MIILLILLLICHYLADYCFTTSAMIRAKADGRNPWPILLHSLIHAVLMGTCLILWGISCNVVCLMFFIELLSHFVVDAIKGRMMGKYSKMADVRQKAYWMLYGFDQLLHQTVIVGIWYYGCLQLL